MMKGPKNLVADGFGNKGWAGKVRTSVSVEFLLRCENVRCATESEDFRSMFDFFEYRMKMI